MTTMETKNNEQDEQALRRLLEIMADLRAEHGCPWDKEQDHKSLRKYVLEEAYEVVDAINQEDDSLIVEELGDLLLQIVFHAQIAKEEGRFTFADIANGISEKMIRRHPHVFGTEHCDTPSEVMVTWAQVKAKEKAGSQERRMDVPLAFPALYRSEKLQKKAAEVGFDWEQSEAVRQKILEELGEVDEAISEADKVHLKEEMGDLLFAVVNWSRFHHIDAEEALRESNDKFVKRFNLMEDMILAQGKSIEDMTLSEMDLYWEKAKKLLANHC